MTRIFTEGIEMGDLLPFVNASQINANTSQARSGTYSLAAPTSSVALGTSIADVVVTSGSEFYVRCGFRTTASPASSATIFAWRKGATQLGAIRLTSTTRLELITSTATVVATGGTILQFNTWYLLEVRVRIGDSGGVLEVKVEGTVDATFTGDTKPGADSDIDTFRWTNALTGANGTFFDDIAINDTSGSTDNGYPGDGKIVAIFPNANGDASDFMGSDGNQVDNYLLVDEVPHDSDTTYVERNTSGSDLYNLATLSPTLGGGTVRRVYVEARSRETTADANPLTFGVKSGGTVSWGPNRTQTTSYARHVGADLTTNPNTGVAWTEAAINALQGGVRIP